MDREDKIIRRMLFTLAGAALFFFLPIVPIQVVPEVSIRAVDTNRNPVEGVTVYQDWQHSTFESQSHKDETVSDENGFAAFSEKRIWISAFNFLFNTVGENTIGLIAIHASFGPSVGFGATGYKTSNKWCYPEKICKNRESAKEIIILEKYEK